MAINQEQFDFCVSNLIAMCVETLQQEYPTKSKVDLLYWFTSSDLCEKLLNRKTGLWKEGPNYLLSLFSKEKKIKFKVLENV